MFGSKPVRVSMSTMLRSQGVLKNAVDWVSRSRATAVPRAARAAPVGIALNGGRQPRRLGVTRAVRAPRRENLCRYVLARPGSHRLRRGRTYREQGTPPPLRDDDRQLHGPR